MQLFIRLITPALISVVLGVLLFNILKNNSKEIIKSLTKEHVTVRLPKAYMWVGVIDIFVWSGFILLMTLFPNGTVNGWVYLLFALFLFLGVFLVWERQVWKIEIFKSEDYFIYRTLFFKTHKILYNDCVSYRFGENTLFVNTKERTLYIDIHAVNFEIFLAMLSKHKIPEVKKHKGK